jgi:hypothetical protein
MADETESIRRVRQAELNAAEAGRGRLEADYGRVWNMGELERDFDVIAFLAPYVVVREKSSGRKGSLEFQHWPRYYFNWRSDGGSR